MIKDLNKALNIISEKDDITPFLTALNSIINKEGKFAEILKKTSFSKQELKDILENNTELFFDDAIVLFKALGYKVTIAPIS